jgi:hypothetical protein
MNPVDFGIIARSQRFDKEGAFRAPITDRNVLTTL